jgi:hypothetical protein
VPQRRCGVHACRRGRAAAARVMRAALRALSALPAAAGAAADAARSTVRARPVRAAPFCPNVPLPCADPRRAALPAQLLPSAPWWFPFYALLCVARAYGELPRWVALTAASCLLFTPTHDTDDDSWAEALPPVALLPWAVTLQLDSMWSATGAQRPCCSPRPVVRAYRFDDAQR